MKKPLPELTINTGPTYGQQVVDHISKGLDLEDDPREYRKVMEPEIMENVYQSIAEAKNHDLYRNKNFYVVLLLNVERIGGVPRTRVFVRQSCPTPVFKQVVWKYHYLSGSLEYLWTIPDSIRYYHILKNPGKYIHDKSYGQTAKFVHLDHSGELLEWVKKENGEKKEGILRLIDKEDSEIIKG